MSKLLFSLVFSLSFNVFAQDVLAPESVLLPIDGATAEEETLLFEGASSASSVYDQMKALFANAKDKPLVTDFDRKGPTQKRICFETRSIDPQVQELTGVLRYSKIIPAIEDGDGVIVPERTIEKIMVGLGTDISAFNNWVELLDDGRQLISVNAPSYNTQATIKHTFRKSGKRIYFRSEGKYGDVKVDSYGICYVPVTEQGLP